MYTRNDIYYCECCGKFYNQTTEQEVEVSLDELIEYPDFRVQVERDRKRTGRGSHLKKAKGAQKSARGFGK